MLLQVTTPSDPQLTNWLWRGFITGLIGIVMFSIKSYMANRDKAIKEVTEAIHENREAVSEQMDKTNAALEAIREDHVLMRSSVAELRTVLVGIDGRNGINGDVKTLSERLSNLEAYGQTAIYKPRPRKR